jgi:hypothetical protein
MTSLLVRHARAAWSAEMARTPAAVLRQRGSVKSRGDAAMSNSGSVQAYATLPSQ